jgi:hypothetical protein
MLGRKSLWKPLRWTPGCALALLLASLSGAGERLAATTNVQNVVVTNTASNPVPVTGTLGATQSGSWTVGIANTISNPVPVAGILGAAQSGSWTVGATQSGPWTVGLANTASDPVPVAGTVNIGGTPTVKLAGGAALLYDSSWQDIAANSYAYFPPKSDPALDISGTRQIRVAVTGTCTQIEVYDPLAADESSYFWLDFVTLSYNYCVYTNVFEVPGDSMRVFVQNLNNYGGPSRVLVWGVK